VNGVDIIARLIARREELGLHRNELSERIGVSMNMVWRWENRLCPPSLPNFLAWANELGIEVYVV
jgi:transcriptional regulator with XRE-family HTH domain